MAAKDTQKAAKAVMDMFGPLVEALPAVIDQLGKEVEGEKRIKQLEIEYNRLVDKYNAQLDKFDVAQKAHDKAMEERRKHFADLEATGAAALKDMANKQREASRKVGEKTKALQDAEAELAKTLESANAKAKEAVKQIEEHTSARLAELSAQIEAAEKRYDETVAKINKLKSSLV